MRLRLTPYSLLILVVMVLASCGSKQNVPVPADASLVLHINGKSLHSKFGWDEFKKGELYQIAMGSNKLDSFQKKILDNPEESGIDIFSDGYIFGKSQGTGGYMAVVFDLKDKDKFEALAKKITDKDVVKEGKLNIIKEHGTVITWTSSRCIIISNNPGMGAGMASGSYGVTRFAEDSLLKFANELYDLKKDKSAGSLDKFSDMMKENGDMHVWLNSELLYGKALASAAPLAKAADLFKGSATAITVNFDNGKINADAKSYYNEKMAAIYEKFTGNLSDDMLKKIPSDNVAMVFASKFPPEALQQLLTTVGVDGLANMFLSDLGFSLDDIVKAMKGDLMIALTDVGYYNMPEEGVGMYRPFSPFKILVATSVNNKPTFDKLLALAQQKTEESGQSFDMIRKMYPHQVTNEWFTAGNDSTLVYGFGSVSKNPEYISKISGHPMGGYVDLQKIISGFRRPATQGMGSRDSFLFDESLKTWKDIVFYGGERKNGAATSHFEINFVDKNTGSLKQLNDYLGKLAKGMEAMDNERANYDPSLSDTVHVTDNTIRAEAVK